MRKLLNVAAMLIWTCGVARGDAKSDLLAAVQKLADAENYSWTTTTEAADGMPAGGATGKAQKDGLVELNLQLRDREIQAYIKGDKAVFKTPDSDWQRVGEATRDDPADRAIVNVLRNYQPPVAQVKLQTSQAQNLEKLDDGSFAGSLSADDAKALIRRRAGRRDDSLEVKNPVADVKFWVDDKGLFSRMQIHMQATMTAGGEERQLDRTTTVELKDIGATKIEVPEAVKAKLQ